MRVADVVLASAVLHFASDEEHSSAMLNELWRVLEAWGHAVRAARFLHRNRGQVAYASRGRNVSRRHERYLVDERFLLDFTGASAASCSIPQDDVVQDERAMTTWVVRKLLIADLDR